MNSMRRGFTASILMVLALLVMSIGYAATNPAVGVVFTNGISNLEPTSILTTASAGETVTAFTELHGVAGKTVVHRWQYLGADGKSAAVNKLDVTFNPTTDRYRTWSEKKLYDAGMWKLEVLIDGKVVTSATIDARSTGGVSH